MKCILAEAVPPILNLVVISPFRQDKHNIYVWYEMLLDVYMSIAYNIL